MKLKFANKKFETSDVWSFFFEPVEPLTWIAGQSIRLELPRAKWGVDERRFTIASAPHESFVQITTRVSQSDFKQTLFKLNPGTQISAYNIEGDFIWGDEKRSRLFLAAGIGITPFRSLIAQQINSNTLLNTTLLYSSNDRPPVFEKELLQWQADDTTLNIHFLDRRISDLLIISLMPQWPEYIVYISGPSLMVEEISTSLENLGLPPKHIKRDLFTGYGP